MRNRHLTPPQRMRAAGFTLVELMVALVLGLVVIGGVMGVFMSTYQANAQNIKAIRLNEEMRAVMSMMSRDIRRAGVRNVDWSTTNDAWYTTANPLATNISWAVSDTAIGTDACLRFAYAKDDTLSNYVGYRLVNDVTTGNPVVQVHYTATTSPPAAWSCGGGGWQPLTDPNIAWVQSLSFTVSKEPELTGVEVRTVIVNLRAGTHTRSTDPSDLTAADCPVDGSPSPNIDIVCRTLIEKIRIRNDAVL